MLLALFALTRHYVSKGLELGLTLHNETFILLFTIKEFTMSIARVTEITSSSAKSFDDAIKTGVDRACKTLKNVEGAWIQDQKVVIKKGKIVEYRVAMKITFILAE
jgi:dodecin